MTPLNILVVDDDPGAIQVLNRVVSGIGQTRFATTGEDALRLAREIPPSLILLDAQLPGMSGFQVCEALKQDRQLREVPVIFVTAHDDADFQAAGFRAGAVDYITKPVHPGLALARIQRQLASADKMQRAWQLLAVDLTTEVLNWRGFDETLRRDWRRTVRKGEPMSLLRLDVDYFSAYEKTLGDSVADDCLRAVTQSLKQNCRRPGDVVARVSAGGFALLLPDTARDGAEHMAHRVLDSVERLGLPHPSSPVAQHVTVTVGVSCYDEDSAAWIPPTPDTHFARLSGDAKGALDLLKAAQLAQTAACRNGRAQAWLLDVADANNPLCAREVSPHARREQPREPPRGDKLRH